MAKKHIIIVGAGPGGLTSAMILAKKGYKVTVFEKHDQVGGRNSEIKLGGYRFDVGPTFLMMKFVLDEVFELAGKKSSDYLDFIKLDPMYRLQFDDFTIEPVSDKERMKKKISELFPGEESGLDAFHAREKVKYDKMYPCLRMDYSSPFKMVSPDLIKALPYLSLGKSLYSNLNRYFTSEKLILSFTFQSKYLGMSPWTCPAAFSMIPYIEHADGIYHTTGGLSEISRAMAKAAKENGAEIHLSSPVEKMIIKDKVIKGVKLSNGKEVMADAVVINADFAHAMDKLTNKSDSKKYSSEKLKKKRFSCSTFMIYLGINKLYDLPHHTICFAKDYKQNIKQIFETKEISEDMSFYVRNASITDKTLAPKGKSGLYVLVPVPNQTSGIDWKKEAKPYRDKLIHRMIEKLGLKDLKENIEEEKILTPDDWEDHYSVYMGATFNLSHDLMQMLYLRPRNRFEEWKNCYLVGGGTHPGSGLPTIYESGRISSELICNDIKN